MVVHQDRKLDILWNVFLGGQLGFRQGIRRAGLGLLRMGQQLIQRNAALGYGGGAGPARTEHQGKTDDSAKYATNPILSMHGIAPIFYRLNGKISKLVYHRTYGISTERRYSKWIKCLNRS